jgi:transposase
MARRALKSSIHRAQDVFELARKEAEPVVWQCDNQLSDAECGFANNSRRSNACTAGLYNCTRARGYYPNAARILARAWLHIIWHCWQTKTAHEPTKHRALQTLVNQQSGTPT